VAAVCRSGYYHAATAAPTAHPIYVNRDREDAGQGVHFVSPGLQQLLFYGMSEGLMSQLRYLQNAAACLVSGARRYDHITSVLQELHRLPVRRRVDFQMATRAGLVTVYLSGKAPAYLAARCHLVSDEGRRQLLSSTSRTCRLQGPAETMESLCLQLQVRSCGTVFQLICDKLTLTFNDLNGY